jgi:frataxin-like iron-binding protein CyaY
MNVNDYKPAVDRVMEYLAAEMDAASPSEVIAYCETTKGDVLELTLDDLVSVAFLGAAATQ